MTDSRLYALLQLLRENGVDVVPGLVHLGDCRWEHTHMFTTKSMWDADAHAAIVVGCQNDALANKGENPVFRKIEVHNTDPLLWLLSRAHARGIAVPDELKGASDEE